MTGLPRNARSDGVAVARPTGRVRQDVDTLLFVMMLVVFGGLASGFDVDDVDTNMIQANGIAKRFVDANSVGVEKMHLVFIWHRLNISRLEQQGAYLYGVLS